MKEHSDHIEHLTPELIKAYHNETLSQAQRHQVEKLMLEDELYGDAMEGLNELSGLEQLDMHLDDLTNRIDDRLNQKASTVFWTNTRKWAAAVTLILVSTLTYQLLQEDTPTKELTELQKFSESESAEDSSKRQEAPKTLSAEIQDTISSQSLLADTKIENISSKTEDSGDLASGVDIDDLLGELTQENENDVRALNEKTELSRSSIGSEAEAQTDIASVLRGKVSGVEISDSGRRSITGKVFDLSDSTALPSVSIYETGTENVAITNTAGEFNIDLTQFQSTLTARFLGYKEKTLAVSDTNFLSIGMEAETVSLDEVVVTRMGITRDKTSLGYAAESLDSASAPARSYTNAERSRRGIDSIDSFVVADMLLNETLKDGKAVPSSGSKSYNQYLSDNLVYPEQAKSQRIRGRVVVEFTVMEDGTTANHKILKSLGYGCDEEAIRLIKEGPLWQPKIENGGPVQSTVKWTIRFKLKR